MVKMLAVPRDRDGTEGALLRVRRRGTAGHRSVPHGG